MTTAGSAERPSKGVIASATVPTPLGGVSIGVAVPGDRRAGVPATEGTPSGGASTTWSEVDGLDVHLLSTPCSPNLPDGMSISACWGGLWTVTASRSTPPLTFFARLPTSVIGSPDSGERLEAVEASVLGTRFHLAGPDDDLLGELVDTGNLPHSWTGLLESGRWNSGWGVFSNDSSGLVWVLPPMIAGERALMWTVAAWKLDGGPDDMDTWFAVDLRPDEIIQSSRTTPPSTQR